MYKFLVTGGAGMIGLEVCKQLSKSGHFVHLFDLGEQIKRVQNHIHSVNNKSTATYSSELRFLTPAPNSGSQFRRQPQRQLQRQLRPL